jgi:hypothetical protein
MMMTVAKYAESRGRSESTVKAWIKKLNLDLPTNPDDKRQRLISNEHQARLDDHGKVTAIDVQPEPTAVEVEVTPYHRTEATSMMIAEGTILEAQLTTYQTPEENPVLQALKAQVIQLEQSNALRYQQVQAGIQSHRDTTTAIAAAKRLQIVEAAQREAVEEFTMRQQLKQQTLNNLELLSLGIPVNQPPAPTPQPSPQSSASSPQPDWL